MTITEQQVHAGQAVYTRPVLVLYDLVVHRVSNRWLWRVPTDRLQDHYQRHLSGNHLDIGVGSGYFPDHCRFPSPQRVALMDLNADALAHAARRIRRYRPERYRRDVLQPIEFDRPGFDSMALFYLFHCLPGSLDFKAVAFDNLMPLMNPGAVISGATLLQGGVERGRAARWLMETYNRKGVFANRDDRLADLVSVLEARFADVSVEVVGCAALFSARKAD